MNIKEFILLVLKGIGIGSANVIPGVSGGTIALLTGIYERFINSIKSFNLKNCKLLITGRLREFLKATDFWFLSSILLGVVISTYSLAKFLVYLLNSYPIATWSFFFGLVLISCFYVAKEIENWNIITIICAILGIGIALFISFATPTQTPDSWWFIMLCGAIAICAMILPGISGSFILVLLGKYEYIMNAIGDLNIPILVIFIVGAIVGLVAFSHLLSWLLKRYRGETIALLTGFMVGSLPKLWPWKGAFEKVSKVSEEVATTNSTITFPTHLGVAIIFSLIAIFLVFILEKAAEKRSREK